MCALFDYDLSIQVQTDDQQSTQTREKDPRSLSGGEKSFATICLLLSLWESIGCPIRCLGMLFPVSACALLTLYADEFDVFMDAVNRRVSMSMMVRFSYPCHGPFTEEAVDRSTPRTPQTASSISSLLHKT